MAKDKSKSGDSIHPIFFLFFAASIGLCICGMLIALVICIDRADELFNNVQYQGNWHNTGNSMYQNRWSPFIGGFVDHVKQIPAGLFNGFYYFPAAALVAVIFYPLLVIVVPIYDGFSSMNFSMLLYGWLPFAAGVMLFIASGVLAEMVRSSRAPKINDEKL